MESKRPDDRISSMEAPLVLPQPQDAYGRPWSQKPDNIVRQHLRSLPLTADEEMKAEGLLAKLDWFELSELVNRVSLRTEGSKRERAQEIRKKILNIMRDQESLNV